ncbi:TPA: recombinase family protein [Klebsiella pneumoniae]|nr:recombinase family protein [Klebsiella pneumoniae]
MDRLLVDIRAGDTIVIWKLDRLGRSLKHLVELVGKLAERKIGLLSLNDPVDTTNAQGRLVFNLFASLAEFERELIQERTLAGLSAARARGRVGGRPKGLSAPAESTAMAAETLYREGRLSVSAIGKKLHISKGTLYRYLRSRGVEIGKQKKNQLTDTLQPTAINGSPITKTATVSLLFSVENNSKFVRGKKRAQANIEQYSLALYDNKQLAPGKYELRIPYENEHELNETMHQLLSDMNREADLCNCNVDANAWEEGTERRW